MYLSDLTVYFKVEVYFRVTWPSMEDYQNRRKKSADYANATNVEFIVDPTVLFHGWLIYSYLQIFKLIKCKWLSGECAEWFFDNIMTIQTIQQVQATKQHFDKWACTEPWTFPFNSY